MFCNNCGKKIESGIFCQECALIESQKTAKEEVALAEIEVEPKTESEPTKEEETVETASDPIVQTDPGSRMVGFGKALASTLLGTAASTYVMVSMVVWTLVEFQL